MREKNQCIAVIYFLIITLCFCGCNASRAGSDNFEGVWYGLAFSSLGDLSKEGYTFDKIIIKEDNQYNSDFHGNGTYQIEDENNLFLTSDSGEITQLRIGSGKDAAEALGVSKIKSSIVLIEAETPELNDGYTVYFSSEKEWQKACEILYSEKTRDVHDVLSKYTWYDGEMYYIFDKNTVSVVIGSSDSQGNVDIIDYIHKDIPYEVIDSYTMRVGQGGDADTVSFNLTQEVTGVAGEGYRLQINEGSSLIPEWDGRFMETAVEYYATGY